MGLYGSISDVSFSIRSRSLLASERLTHSERETKSAHLCDVEKLRASTDWFPPIECLSF